MAGQSYRVRGISWVSTMMLGMVVWSGTGWWAPSVGQAADAALSETPEVQFSSVAAADLKAKADALASPVAIYEYVRNTAEYKPYHGSRSNSINTFLGQRGNDVDLASTLIAMLRARGIPARYAVGNIQMPADDLMNWLGVQDLDLAITLLEVVGIQQVSLSADRSYAEFEHAWVEAQVAHDNYRGAGMAGSIDCTVTPATCRWVSLDPSFKLKTYHNQALDVYENVSFDYTSYYNAIKNDDATRMDKNPLEIYEEQILAYLRTNYPGKTLEDVADPGVIVRDDSLILPNSLPYVVVGSTVRRYNSVADHDAATENEPKHWGKTLQMTAILAENTSVDLGTYLLADLSTRRLMVSSEVRETTVRIVARLDGVEKAAGSFTAGQVINNIPMGLGFPFRLKLDVETSPATSDNDDDLVIERTDDSLIVGGYYVIAIGGESSNFTQVHRAAEGLLQANQEYAIVNDEQGVPYVDANSSGTIDSGEVPLLEDATAMEALTGGLLQVSGMLYMAEAREQVERLASFNLVVSPVAVGIGVISSVHEVEYVEGTAFSVLPGGLLIDVMYAPYGGWRSDGSDDDVNAHLELTGHALSSLEHEIWQKLTGYDAISTVRGIQMALADSATLAQAKKNDTSNTLPTFYQVMGFGASAPSPFVRKQRLAFGSDMTTWQASGTHGMELFKKSVYGNTPEYRKAVVEYWSTNDLDRFVQCFSEVEGVLIAIRDHPLLGPNYYLDTDISVIPCSGWISGYPRLRGVVSTLLSSLNNYYWSVINGSPALFAFFNKHNGFVHTDYVYRKITNAVDVHDAGFISGIRDAVSEVSSPNWQEFVIPSLKTTGATYRFVVYIRNFYDGTDLEAAGFIIRNDSFLAGGGYVDGSEALEQAKDTSGVVFDNEDFTDKNLNRDVHNDIVKTPSTVDPISTVTGNNYHDETDVVVKGRGLNLVFTRTYNSGPTTINTVGLPLGHGWSHSYNMRLRSNDYGDCPNCEAGTGDGQRPENGDTVTSSITYVDERGGEMNYLAGAGADPPITPPTGVFDALQADWATGTYTLTFRNGVQYIFEGVAPDTDLRVPDRVARLTRIEDPAGNVLALTYDGSGRLSTIQDGLGISGRTGLTFTYDANNRLQDVTDWTSRTWTYAYDTNGHLISMTNPLNDMITYAYEPGTHHLTTVTLAEDRDNSGAGDVVTTFKYYENSKAFMNENAFGQGETLEYDLFRKSTRVTDPRGFVREYFYDKNGRLTKLVQPDKAILLFQNNATDGLRYQKTDGLGYTTTYSYRTDRSLNGEASDTGGNVTREQDALAHTIDTTYGIYDQPTEVKDKNGNVVTVTYYDSNDLATGAVKGKVKRVSVRIGGTDIPVQDFEYGAGGVVTKMIEYIDPVSPPNTSKTRVTEYAYDASGLNVTKVEVTGSGETIETTYTYDSLGRTLTETIKRQTSPLDATLVSLTTSYAYDDLDRVIKETDPLGNETVTTYDKNGNVTQVMQRFKKVDNSYDERVVITRVYDAADRLISNTDVNGAVTRYGYDEAGNRIQMTDANGHVTRYEYDDMGQQTAVINATGHRTTSVYDLAGRKIKEVDPNGQVTQFAYDALGRLTTVTDPLGYQTTNTYDANGNLLTMKDANGHAGLSSTNTDGATTSWQYDEFNRVTQERDALDGTTLYTYDLLGNRTSITDAEGRTTMFEYDDLGRLVTTTDPLVETPTDKVVTFTYDEAGNVLTKTNRKGEVARYFYDALNRLVKAEYLVANSVTYQEDYAYDHFGDRTVVTNGDVTYTFAYDRNHRVIQKSDNRPPSVSTHSLLYTYDAVGNILTKTDYQNSVTSYRYDRANRLVGMQNPDYVAVSYHYDPAGRLLTRILSNGTTTAYEYDNGNRLVSLATEHANGSVVGEETYTRDRVGNITTVVRPEGTTTYTYDALYRLTAADYPNTSDDYSYTYDKVGNRLTRTIGADTLTYEYNEGNRLVAIRNDGEGGELFRNFDYDDEGNMIAKRDGFGSLLESYSWGPKGRMTEVRNSKGTFVYAYDPFDYRISKAGPGVSVGYLLEGEHVEAMTGSHQPAQFFRGVVVDEIVNGYQYNPNGDWTNYTYAHDSLQSVVGLTGHEGRTIQTTAYSPFGNERETAGASCSVLRYTGREQDAETGLYYYRARYYDPELGGRFISEDPLKFEAGINHYVYVNNNPINANDPSGKTAVGAFLRWLGQKGAEKGARVLANEHVRGGAIGGGGAATGHLATGGDIEDTPTIFAIGALSGGLLGPNITEMTGKLISNRVRAEVTGSIATGFLSDATANFVMNHEFDLARSLGQGILNAPGAFLRGALESELVSRTLSIGSHFLQQLPDFLRPPEPGFMEPGGRGGIHEDFTTASRWPQSSWSPTSGSGGAFGGFLLYPNKPNTNLMRQVYSK